MPDRVCQVHGHLVWVKLKEAVTRIAQGVFLALLESVNVCLGLHVSNWAAGCDIPDNFCGGRAVVITFL